ncbi:ribosome-associated translation inhibitor RaiA [Aliifodinibius sp. S!AR15-10]|uniref:ribosome hibernation-promoting factor, HPF/YfiA family n=1 Tax=Aliifodinibius sp. S!AR15-10 TaxID=2950437 RepID=UPI00285A290B|nr:ribosome-associated translation inhibitor RaiA [Aliifodinibius sp. S!AR15-10]MDR8391818.1 ribosome-associated translation inhibitor RaiA [Aliifodinibius sp. S!AR15-10]
MKTTFTARHFDASQQLKQYSVDAVQKLDQFYDRIVTCDIILEPTPDDEEPQQAELNVKIPQKLLNAKEKAPTYEQAMNRVVDNITRQLKKYKNKHFTNH